VRAYDDEPGALCLMEPCCSVLGRRSWAGVKLKFFFVAMNLAEMPVVQMYLDPFSYTDKRGSSYLGGMSAFIRFKI
jgi:hypothetical protein